MTGTDFMLEKSVYSTQSDRLELIEYIINFFDRNFLYVTIDRYEFYLILDEAVSNAMEHGNKWNKSKKIQVRIYRKDNSKIGILIKDEGDGFDTSLVSTTPNGSPITPLRGRGIFIMKTFCEVAWNESGNEVNLILKMKSANG